MAFSDRKFGVEIECIGKTISEIKELFQNNNIEFSDDDYDYSQWTIKEDGSIRAEYKMVPMNCYGCGGSGRRPVPYSVIRSQQTCGYCQGTGKQNRSVLKGAEVVSPILSGEKGLEEVEKVCKLLKDNGIKANSTCGLHVHVYAKDYQKSQVINVFNRYSKYEQTIDKWMAPSRRRNSNSYCFSTKSSSVGEDMSLDELISNVEELCDSSLEEKVALLYSVFVEKKSSTKSEKKILSEITSTYFNMDRHCKINLNAYLEHGTVEFRHHHGTVDQKKIKNWIMFCVQFFEQSVKKEQPQKDYVFSGVSRNVKEYYKAITVKNATKKTVTKKKAA